MKTKTMLIVTGLIAIVAVMASATMVKLVYAPGGTCASCGALFAPGQLKITQPAIGIGILARELGQPASQLAPGQQFLNSPG